MLELIIEFNKTNPEAGRQIMNSYIATLTDPDLIARAELLREYTCNPEFAQAVNAEVWQKVS